MKLGRVDWIDLAQDMDKWRDFVKKKTNLQVPCNVKNFWTNPVTISLSRTTLVHAASYRSSSHVKPLSPGLDLTRDSQHSSHFISSTCQKEL